MTTAIAEAFARAAATEDDDDRALMARKARPIYGAPFTFRTFADGVFGAGRSAAMREDIRTLDRLVTVTLPAITLPSDERDRVTLIPTIKIEL